MVCPHCGLGGTASGELYEKKVRCPECQKIFRATTEVIVELPLAAAVERADQIRQETGDHKPAASALSEAAKTDDYHDTATSLTPNQCTVCGFFFSDAFISIVADKSICNACAG